MSARHMAERREYALGITVNGERYERLLIDPHYEVSHHDSVDDFLIRRMVMSLNGLSFLKRGVSSDGFQIFVNDPWVLDGLSYRLIWTTHPAEDFIGVINAFRR